MVKGETYIVIYIGVDSVRLIFIQDRKVIHINRYLGLNLERQGLIGFISSKIVLEMEYAGISEFSNIILTGEINEEIISAFKLSFPFSTVECLSFDYFDIDQLSEDEKSKFQSYSLPILGVYDTLFTSREIKKDLEVHSNKISRISFIRKIDFISIILSLLIFFVIFVSSKRFLENQERLKLLTNQQKLLTNISSTYLDDLATIDHLNLNYGILNTYLNKLKEFESKHINWTDQLITIHSFNMPKNNIWLTSITLQEENNNRIVLQGLAIDRVKVTDFIKILNQPLLKNIYIYEIRGKKIFQFEIESDIRMK